MMNESGKGEIVLNEVPEKLRKARELAPNVPCVLHDFCDYLAEVSNDNLYPAGMMTLLFGALIDLDKGYCGFARKATLPEKLIDEKLEVVLYFSFFPRIIDKIASKEFAEEFRELFTMFHGEAEPPLEEEENDYGITIIEEGVVDISNKDKAEVLAALYNNSHPQGLGFIQYDSKKMTTEEARELLKQTLCFDYLYGRVMKVSFEGDILRTWLYNRDNGKDAAERIISHCRNIK